MNIPRVFIDASELEEFVAEKIRAQTDWNRRDVPIQTNARMSLDRILHDELEFMTDAPQVEVRVLESGDIKIAWRKKNERSGSL
jgi:hypothetical protein